MYLLRYKREGEWRVVVIAEAYSVAHARMVAAGLAAGQFIGGQQVDPAAFPRLPRDALGRVLTLGDLMGLATARRSRAPHPCGGGGAGPRA
jgi:hypothetical protein